MGDAKIMYGKFLQTCVDFVIIALVIFLDGEADQPLPAQGRNEPPAAAPPRDVQLLEEIRDLLKNRTNS